MSPPINACAGCQSAIVARQYIKCSSCGLRFDLDCANLPLKRYQLMTAESRQCWKCPACRSAEPKKDNSNTPIRPAAQVPHELGNVTVRSVDKPDDLPEPGGTVTHTDMRTIIREEISNALNSMLKVTIAEVVSEKFQSLNDSISSIEASLNFINSQYEQMKTTLAEKVDTINQLQKQNESLVSTVKDLSQRVGDIEQQMRVNNVEINGIPEHSNENLTITLAQLGKTVEYPLDSNDILLATRVAKLQKDSPRPRTVIAKFRSRAIRDGLIAAVSKFNKANAADKLSSTHLGCGGPRVPVFVSEHLSLSNKRLHAAARLKAKDFHYKFVWIRDGRIYVRKNETSQALYIRNTDSLQLIK